MNSSEPPSGNLLEAFEKLAGICVPKAITREIEGLAGFELFVPKQQAQHADDFGRLDIGDPVNEFVRVIEPLAHDAPGMSRVLYGQRSEKRISNALDLVEPDQRRIENVRHELPFDVHRVGFIEPDVKGRLHGRHAAALVVFELMHDHRVGIEQELVERVFADQRCIGDDGSVSGIFHTSEIGPSHADGPIGIARIFIVLGFFNPEDRLFEDFHRDLSAVWFRREEQGIRD